MILQKTSLKVYSNLNHSGFVTGHRNEKDWSTRSTIVNCSTVLNFPFLCLKVRIYLVTTKDHNNSYSFLPDNKSYHVVTSSFP